VAFNVNPGFWAFLTAVGVGLNFLGSLKGFFLAISPMNRPVLIAPSLLAADLADLKSVVSRLEAARVDLLHFDVMDGHFVPNLTMGIAVVESVRRHTSLPFDAHLMVTDPAAFVEAFAKAGCQWFSFHIEAVKQPLVLLQKIRSLKMRAGIAINPETPLSSIKSVLGALDYVLVMSVSPGFGGQGFVPSVMDKIRELRSMPEAAGLDIQVDGGIKKENLAQVVAAGANVIVMGTGFFKYPDYGVAMTELKGVAGVR